MDDKQLIVFLCRLIFKIYGGDYLSDNDWQIIRTEMSKRGKNVDKEGVFDEEE